MTPLRHPRAWRAAGPVAALAVCLGTAIDCGQPVALVEYRPGHDFSRAERHAIEAIVNRAVTDVRAVLLGVPADLRITVQAGTRVIPETGETGSVGVPRTVYWTVDPAHDGGVIGVANAWLRATLFHELYHLVRETVVPTSSLRDRIVNEGLATAFERDLGGGAPPPWGAYPADALTWVGEFLALPRDAAGERWSSLDDDGRRWFGYKVGTWMADEAVRRSGRSLVSLATVPTGDILDWAWARQLDALPFSPLFAQRYHGVAPSTLGVIDTLIPMRPLDANAERYRQLPPALRRMASVPAPTRAKPLDPRMVPPSVAILAAESMPSAPTAESLDVIRWNLRQRGFAFSDALMTPDGLDALIYYEAVCGGTCGEAGYAWVQRQSLRAPWALEAKLVIGQA